MQIYAYCTNILYLIFQSLIRGLHEDAKCLKVCVVIQKSDRLNAIPVKTDLKCIISYAHLISKFDLSSGERQSDLPNS